MASCHQRTAKIRLTSFRYGFRLHGDSLETGDLVGVFFTDNDENYKCAGSLTWKANDFNMLPVWGQYPTGTDNGMEMGEKMIWLAQKSGQHDL